MRTRCYVIAVLGIVGLLISNASAHDDPDIDPSTTDPLDTHATDPDPDHSPVTEDAADPWEGRDDPPSQLERFFSDSDTVETSRLSNDYPLDTRRFDTLDPTEANPLPGGIILSGFMKYEPPDAKPHGSSLDLPGYSFKLDLKRTVWEDLRIVLELNDASGLNNALSRVRLIYSPKLRLLKDLGLSFLVKFFPYERDGNGYQVIFSWDKRFPDFFDGRFSIGGFFNTNFENGPGRDEVRVVSDTRFQFRLVDGLDLLAELRFNEFLGPDQDLGVGFGLRYRF